MVQLGHRAETVYRELLRNLDAGLFAPHARLPGEDELCTRFGVSRSAVRAALRRLGLEGRVVSRRGAGTYVQPAGAAGGNDHANVISIMHGGTLADLTRIQQMVLEAGCLMSVFSQSQEHWNPASERQFLEQVRIQRHRALLAFCSPREPHNDDLLRELQQAGVPVIHMEPYRDTLPEESYLMPDYYHAGYMAAVSLLLAGYRPLLVAGMPDDGPYGQQQKRGFLDAAREHATTLEAPGATTVAPGAAFYEMPRRAFLPEAQAATAAFVRNLGGRVGILTTSVGRGTIILDSLLAHGIAVPDQAGLICTATIGCSQAPDTRLDTLWCDRMALYARAIREVRQSGFAGIRELVKPQLVRHGSVAPRRQ